VTVATPVEVGSSDATDISGVTLATLGGDARATSEVTLPTPYPVALPSDIDPVTLPSGRRTNMNNDALLKNDASGRERRPTTSSAPRRDYQKRKTALTPDWWPSHAGVDFAFQHGMTGDRLDDEVEKFRAYHAAHGNLMQSWDAAWRQWALNDKKFRKANGPRGGRRSTYADILTEEDAA
jgi:hypothetical protein